MKKYLRKSFLYNRWRAWADKRTRAKEVADWVARGRPAPPPHSIKQDVIRFYARKFGARVFVETGTYYGDMVEALKYDFDTLYSIELSPALYEKARLRFEGQRGVDLICGDSGIVLGAVVERLTEPAIFWLDGHYSEGVTARGGRDTPILAELAHILRDDKMRHVVVIDDARCFGRDADYPSVQELTDFIREINPAISIYIEDDSIRLLPGA